jgi:two-component system, sensor histidine kinase PdtaS
MVATPDDRADDILSVAYGRAIIDLAEDAIVSIDDSQRIVVFNRGAEKIFGYTAAEALGRPLDLLLPTQLLQAHTAHIREFAGAPESTRRLEDRPEIMGRRKNGEEFPAEGSISKARVGKGWFFTVILRDVTQRKQSERRIQSALREQTALLKEVHHRVKNNLQVVTSLLGLQSMVIPDPATRKMFQESQNRIHSMALLHEQLYQSQDISQINCGEYIKGLAGHLFRSYGVSTSRIELAVQVEELHMSMDTAVPLGLVVNELVSNCLKYAFPDGRKGKIKIQLSKCRERPCCLAVADNGVGLAQDVTLWSSKSLGLRLVKMLAEQMDAHVEVNARHGTKVKLVFSGTCTL